jgi:hypothetical protein
VRSAALAGGIALAAAAFASVFWLPERLQAILYVQSSGANEVHVPFGYGLIAAGWLVAVAASLGVPLGAFAARGILAAFATHILILLAAFVPQLADAGAFTSPAYQMYARLFAAAILLAGCAWSARTFRDASPASLALVIPVAIASAVLAVMLLRADPIIAVAAIGAGVFAGSPGGGVQADRLISRLRAPFAGDRLFILALFVVALVLRMLYLRRVMSNPGYVETGADGPVYDELAWSIAQGHGVRESFTDRFPLLLLGYVWFVSFIYRIAGHSYFAVGLVQAVIGSATCVVFYDVARELMGTAVARTAAVFAAISFPLIFAAAAIGHQAIDVFLTMAIAWCLVKGGSPAEWHWSRWIAVGALFGVAIAVRETAAFFLVFVLIWTLFVLPRPSSLAAAAAVLVTAIAVISPLALPKIASAEQRDKLRHHFDVLYRGEFDVVRMRDDIVAPLEDPRAALVQLRESPAFVLGTLGRAWLSNFAMQFFSQPYGGFDLVFLMKGTEYYYSVWFYAYALTCGGLVMAWQCIRRHAHATGIALVLGLIASRTLPHVLLESNYRHRVPIEPFLILLAALAVVQLVTAARRVAPAY